MTILYHLAVILGLAIVLPLVLQELVARGNARMVDQSALAYTGARSREALVNQRAHVNRDPRFAQNPAVTGFIFFYDCRETDLVVEGVLPRCKFFGISVYDRYSMPGEAMVIDDDVRDGEGRDGEGRDGEGRFVAFLTTCPSGARNEIDVRAIPQGTGIIRYSHMERPETIDEIEPTLATVAPADREPPQRTPA